MSTIKRPGRHAPDLPPMCGSCAGEWAAWLDIIPRPAFRIWPGIGARTYDETGTGIEWLRAAKADDIYGTIRWQQEHIERLCAEGNHVAAGEAGTG